MRRVIGALGIVLTCGCGPRPALPPPPVGMIAIPGGTFLMGTRDGMPHEAPAHPVTLDSFRMDAAEVTVAEFARFVATTAY